MVVQRSLRRCKGALRQGEAPSPPGIMGAFKVQDNGRPPEAPVVVLLVFSLRRTYFLLRLRISNARPLLTNSRIVAGSGTGLSAKTKSIAI